MTKIKNLNIFDSFKATSIINYDETNYHCVFESDGENFKLLFTVLKRRKLYDKAISHTYFQTI